MSGPGAAEYGHAMDTPPKDSKNARATRATRATRTPEITSSEESVKAAQTTRSSTPGPRAALTAWGGAVVYALVVGLLIGGVPYAAGPLLGAVLLLAVTPSSRCCGAGPWQYWA